MTAGIILHAPLRTGSPGAAWQAALLQALPYARRLQITSCTPAAQRATLGGLALALVGAERVTGRAYSPRVLMFPQDGKPRFEAGPFFSVSHAETRVAVATSSTLNVGLDIEDCADSDEAANEQKLVRWTATEALLKAHGLGLRDADSVTLDASLACGEVHGQRYTLQALTHLPGVTGHLAAPVQADWTSEEIVLGDGVFSAALERSLGLLSQVE